jgi:arylsulfatase A-like enzyme
MSPKPSNLIFVYADQLRRQSLGYAGDTRAQTPHLDRLAAEGVDFRNAVSGHPVCAAYRASLFTGKYSSSTGMVINDLRMNPNHDCIGHVLTRNGYRAAYIGKWHLYANTPGDRDKTENQFVPPGKHRLGFDDYWAAYNFMHRYNDGFYYLDTPERIDVEGYEPDAQTDLAIDYLSARATDNDPFALFLSYGAPHNPTGAWSWDWDSVPERFARMFRDVPFPPPPNYRDGSGKDWNLDLDEQWWLDQVKPNLERYHQVYYAMTANLDWNVGRLLSALDKAGLADDTIFVFTSDHGEMFGAHGKIDKLTFYEEACRIPFLVRWPRRVPRGLQSDACLDTPDVMPTLLRLLDLPVPGEVEGADLSHCALGRSGPEPQAAFLQGMGSKQWWLDGWEWRALRDKRHTYAIQRADKTEFLFDKQADPFQMTNLAPSPQHAATLDRFRAMLRKRMAERNDTFEACTWYGENWTEDRIIRRGARG